MAVNSWKNIDGDFLKDNPCKICNLCRNLCMQQKFVNWNLACIYDGVSCPHIQKPGPIFHHNNSKMSLVSSHSAKPQFFIGDKEIQTIFFLNNNFIPNIKVDQVKSRSERRCQAELPLQMFQPYKRKSIFDSLNLNIIIDRNHIKK